jgi:hypothetical protein
LQKLFRKSLAASDDEVELINIAQSEPDKKTFSSLLVLPVEICSLEITREALGG